MDGLGGDDPQAFGGDGNAADLHRPETEGPQVFDADVEVHEPAGGVGGGAREQAPARAGADQGREQAAEEEQERQKDERDTAKPAHQKAWPRLM